MNNLKTSNIKICSDSEIHVIKLPDSLQNLKDLIPTIFLAQLPQHWDLTYNNSSNEKITLHTEQDFQALITNELSASGKSKAIKVFVQSKQIVPEKPAFKLQDSNIESVESEYYHIIDSDFLVKPKENVAVSLVKEDFPPLEKIQEVKIETVEMGVSEPLVMEVKPDHMAEYHAHMEVYHQKMKEYNDITMKLSEKNSQKDSIAYYESHYEPLAPVFKVENQFWTSEVIAQPSQKKSKSKKVKAQEKSLEEQVEAIIEKNIARIAEMTSKALQNKASAPQVQDQPEEKVVHKTVRCNGCHVFPIVGVRYKCTICRDYDLCEACEGTRDHIHALIKIKYPGQPYKHGDKVKKYGPPRTGKAGKIAEPVCVVAVPKEEEKPCEEISSMKKARIVKKRVQFAEEAEVLPIIAEEPPKEVVEEKEKEIIEEKKEETGSASGSEWERPIIKKVPVKKEFKKVYPLFVKNKARQLQQLLPEAEFEKLLEFVEKSKESVDIVELMEIFQLLQLE